MIVEVGGVRVEVIELHQQAIYADVIEGLPDAKINDGIIARALDQARRLNPRPHLVPPRRRPLGPRGEQLPRIACVARVRGPRLHPDAEFGEVALVWFQDDLSSLVATEVSGELETIAWTEIATDVFW